MIDRVIADVDTALGIEGGDIDDAYALALLAAFPEQVQLAGVTVVGGNVTLPSASRSTRLVCELLNLEVLVAEGAAGPRDDRRLATGHSLVLKQEDRTEEWIFSQEPARLPASVSAIELMDQLTRIGPVDILAVAPLTNIAAFLEAHPRRHASIRRIVTMGGLFLPEGGVEFNTQTDPVAAEYVYNSGVPMVIIPFEMTRRTRLLREEVVGWNCEGPLALFAEGTLSWIEQMRVNCNMEGCHLHDPLAAAYLLRPDIFETRGFVPAIDTVTGHTRQESWNETSPHRLVTNFDETAFSKMFAMAMRRLMVNPMQFVPESSRARTLP